MRQYDRAIATWDRVIELDPKFIPAYRGRGKIYLERREYFLALASFVQALMLALT